MATTGAAFAEDTIKYGLASAFSGPAASWGSMMEISVQLAIDDINAAGGVKVGGKSYKLELSKYDHAYDPTKAVTVVRQAVQQDGIKYLEILGGGVVPPIQPITEPAKVLVFAVGTGESWLGTKTPYTFRTFWNSSQSAIASLTAAKNKKPDIKSAVAMYPDDDLGHAIAATVAVGAEKLGIKFETVFTARDVTDFYPVALKIMQNPPDVIDVGITPSSQYAQMVKQLGENGYQGTFIFSDTIDKDAIDKTGIVDAVIGGYTSPYWANFESERGKSWMDRFVKRYGSLQMWPALEYDNLWLLKAAIEKAGTFEDTEKVAEALGEVEIDGLAGHVRYGGAATYGLPRAFTADTQVAVVKKDGDSIGLEQVLVYKP